VTNYGTPRPRVHVPVKKPWWRRVWVRVTALVGGAAAFGVTVLTPIVSDWLKEATAGTLIYASASSQPPLKGCGALKGPLRQTDRDAITLDPEPDEQKMVQGQGGAWVGTLSINLILQAGKGSSEIPIKAIKIVPMGPVGPPLSGALLCHPTAGTAGVPQLTVNLDAMPSPVVKLDGTRYPDKTQLKVTPEEALQLHLQASITRVYLEFVIQVIYRNKDKDMTLTLTDGEEHRRFRITGSASHYPVVFRKGIGTGYREEKR
jgi:hypothetical protein